MNDLNIYTITAAIADPVRLSVMIYLIRGRATYSEIQQYLDISQSNLSNHLAVLYKTNLIKKISIGRRNSYEIANSDAAQLIELLQNMQKTAVNRQPVKNIAIARTCYDHVAGKLGVSIFNALHERNAIIYTAPAADLPYFSEDVRLALIPKKLSVPLAPISHRSITSPAGNIFMPASTGLRENHTLQVPWEHRPRRPDERADRKFRPVQKQARRRGGERPRCRAVVDQVAPAVTQAGQYRLHGGQLHGGWHAQRAGAHQRVPKNCANAICGPGDTGWFCHDARRRFSGRGRTGAAWIGRKRRATSKPPTRWDYIFGYTCFLSTARRAACRPSGFFAMKSRDTFAPIQGPCIVTKDEIQDPEIDRSGCRTTAP